MFTESPAASLLAVPVILSRSLARFLLSKLAREDQYGRVERTEAYSEIKKSWCGLIVSHWVNCCLDELWFPLLEDGNSFCSHCWER